MVADTTAYHFYYPVGVLRAKGYQSGAGRDYIYKIYTRTTGSTRRHMTSSKGTQSAGASFG